MTVYELTKFNKRLIIHENVEYTHLKSKTIVWINNVGIIVFNKTIEEKSNSYFSPNPLALKVRFRRELSNLYHLENTIKEKETKIKILETEIIDVKKTIKSYLEVQDTIFEEVIQKYLDKQRQNHVKKFS